MIREGSVYMGVTEKRKEKEGLKANACMVQPKT